MLKKNKQKPHCTGVTWFMYQFQPFVFPVIRAAALFRIGEYPSAPADSDRSRGCSVLPASSKEVGAGGGKAKGDASPAVPGFFWGGVLVHSVLPRCQGDGCWRLRCGGERLALIFGPAGWKGAPSRRLMVTKCRREISAVKTAGV